MRLFSDFRKPKQTAAKTAIALVVLSQSISHLGFLGLGRLGRSSDRSRQTPRPQDRQRGAVAVAEHLDVTQIEAQAISELRTMVAKSRLKHVPEALLQRCCIASNNDVFRAYSQLRSILKWRELEGVDHILDDPNALIQERWYRKLLHYGLTGQDRKGRAVMIEAIGQWDMDALDRAAREKRDAILRSHVVVCETLLKQAQDSFAARSQGSSHQLIQRMPGFVAVLDMDNISWKQNPMSYAPVLQALKDVSQINAKYYPEAVEHVFVVNTPSIFRSIWRLIAPFVLPSSGLKVDILPKGDTGVLIKECGTDVLPVQLGGRLPANTPPYMS